MSALLRPEDYPPQDAPPPAANASRAEAMRRGAGVEGRDCRYGEDIYQRIALFVPPRPSGTLLAFMHGGGWTTGFKEVLSFMAPGLMEAGIVFASVGYRLAPAHLFPEGFEDAARAMAWLHAHAAGFGGDPGRLFVGGHSAGGHYAALLALRRDWQARHGLPADAIKGCLPVSGVYDFTATGGLSMRPRFLGPEGNGSEREASPLLKIADARPAAPPPPFLMAHGDDDFPHLVRQAEAMQAALRRAGGEVERIVLPGCTHFTAVLATSDPALPWRRRAIEWMSSH